MTIPWADIFAMILKMIEDCKPPEPADARILNQLRNPGLLQRLRLSRGVREAMGLSGKEWREQGDAIMDEIYADARDATDDELREMISTARAAA